MSGPLSGGWRELDAADPGLFGKLREAGPAEAWVRFEVGTADAPWVEIPAVLLSLQGRLRVEPGVDRFAVVLPGWEAGSFVWLARRRGRGRPDYWQGALEHHTDGRPDVVLYFTAPLDGLRLAIRPLPA